MNTPRKPTTQKQLNRAERTQSALFAFDSKLNVFPVALGNKLPIKDTPVKPLDYMRLCWTESEIRELFSNFDVNIAVKLGETSLNTFVVDIDDPGRAIEAMTRLASHQIRTLTVKSPKRGYHFYFSCTNCAIAGATFSYGDIKGQGGYVLFAGSVVDGKPYSLIDASKPHLDTLSNLEALLTDVLSEPIKLKPTTYGRGQQWYDLPPGAVVEQRGRFWTLYHEYLDTSTPVGNRKNKLYKNTLYARATGKPLNQVEAAAQRDGLPQSEINRVMTAAKLPDNTKPVIGGQSHHWHSALQFIDTYRGWSKGQQGNTQRKVMLALIERARMDANEHGVFRATIREIKALAQTSYTPAINKALSYLIEQGLLIRVGGQRQRGLLDCGVSQPINGGQAAINPLPVSKKLEGSRWQFTKTVLHNLHSRELRSQETDVLTVYVSQQHEFMQDTRKADLLERGSIGQTGVRVYAYLMANNGAPSQAVIARALDMSTAAISRTLHKLSDEPYKLVEYVQDEKRWYAIPMADDEWVELAQADIDRRGKSRYQARIGRFAKERHDNLRYIYYTLLVSYQRRLEWHEKQELANDPLIAEAFDLGAAKIERLAS